MTSTQLYFGAIAIFLGLVLAVLFSQPAYAFSTKTTGTHQPIIRMQIAVDATDALNALSPKGFDFYIGIDPLNNRPFKADNFYPRNQDIHNNPVEIGSINMRF